MISFKRSNFLLSIGENEIEIEQLVDFIRFFLITLFETLAKSLTEILTFLTAEINTVMKINVVIVKAASDGHGNRQGVTFALSLYGTWILSSIRHFKVGKSGIPEACRKSTRHRISD